jgi:L-lactate permease
MKQSINLYRIETITKPQLSIARMAMLWLGFLLLAISFVLWQAHQFKALQTQLNTALEMKNSAEYKLNATHLTTQNTIANHPAKDEALKIKEKIHSIEAKINWLQQQSAQPSVPLTAYLEAMAGNTLMALWCLTWCCIKISNR